MNDAAGSAPRKKAIRTEAHRRRAAQPDKDELSRRIAQRLAGLPEYAAASTILFYVDARDEVRTRPLLAEALAGDKTVIVPYCVGDQLGLFRLADLAELAEGTFGILEPRRELRDLPARRVEAREIDLVVVPVVAFDARGNRLGHGAGYYDRFLRQVRHDAPKIAMAFACQMFAEIPADAHDVPVDRIVTETDVFTRPRDAE
ncbi:MAG: 5-formyltetrahydrofolate cyclo-ligase [Pirellulales bacterium]|nr:5-formyltetrahydrofolate cyclo-ligase [Pirellulales bacterium]